MSDLTERLRRESRELVRSMDPDIAQGYLDGMAKWQAADRIDQLEAEREALVTREVEEWRPLLRYVDDVREAALEVGGVDHTTEAGTIIRALGARIDQLEQAGTALLNAMTGEDVVAAEAVWHELMGWNEL